MSCGIKESNLKPTLVDSQFNTFAMIVAKHGFVPPKKYQHDKFIKNYKNETVYQILLQNKVKNIPEHWKYDLNMFDKDGNTPAMKLALKGQIPLGEYLHKPDLTNNKRQTVAMMLADNGLTPPQQWMHNPVLQDNDSETVAIKFLLQDQPVPAEWCYTAEYFLYNGQTTALYLASKGKIPKGIWVHSCNIKNKLGISVPMYLIDNGIIPPPEWRSNQFILQQQTLNYYNNEQLNNQFTDLPQMDFLQIEKQNQSILTEQNTLLAQNEDNNQLISNIMLEQISEFSDLDTFGNTIAMQQALKGQQPQEKYLHSPELTNNNGQTVAMLLASKGIVPPKEWIHNPILQDQTQQCTVAMYLAKNKIIPPEEWYHDPNLINSNGNTVYMILMQQGMTPPEQWKHNSRLQDSNSNVCNIIKDKDIKTNE